ncbi:MAG: thioredoxin domain-containing protein [Desulfurococcales archaeon]|nr:thioredoxin domain-containing protein [Desulfurococcales archaeon]
MTRNRKRLRLSGERAERPITLTGLLKTALVIAVIILALELAMAKTSDKAYVSEASSNVIDVKSPDQSLEKIIESNEKVLLFWEQKNCPGCKVLRPYIDQVAEERGDILIVKVHIDEIFYRDRGYGLKLLQDYQVPGTPTLIAYKSGVEVGRQVGLFSDAILKGTSQYDSLVKFIDSSFSKPVRVEAGNQDKSRSSLISDPLKSLALGVLAAFAPCSVPMIAAFASVEGRSTRPSLSRAVQVLTTVTGATLTFGFVLTLLYIASFLVRSVNPYSIALVVAGSFVASWGVYNVMGKEPLITSSRMSRTLFPILGLQCSLPFMILALSMASSNPLSVILASIAFALGYSSPYIVAAYASKSLSTKIARLSSSLLRLQGMVLLIAGLYVIYEAHQTGIFSL